MWLNAPTTDANIASLSQWNNIVVASPYSWPIPDWYYLWKTLTATWWWTTLWTWTYIWSYSTTPNHMFLNQFVRTIELWNKIFCFALSSIDSLSLWNYWGAAIVWVYDKTTWSIQNFQSYDYPLSWNRLLSVNSSYVNWTNIYINFFEAISPNLYLTFNTTTNWMTWTTWNNTTWTLTNTTSVTSWWKTISTFSVLNTSIDPSLTNNKMWYSWYITIV